MSTEINKFEIEYRKRKKAKNIFQFIFFNIVIFLTILVVYITLSIDDYKNNFIPLLSELKTEENHDVILKYNNEDDNYYFYDSETKDKIHLMKYKGKDVYLNQKFKIKTKDGYESTVLITNKGIKKTYRILPITNKMFENYFVYVLSVDYSDYKFESEKELNLTKIYKNEKEKYENSNFLFDVSSTFKDKKSMVVYESKSALIFMFVSAVIGLLTQLHLKNLTQYYIHEKIKYLLKLKNKELFKELDKKISIVMSMNFIGIFSVYLLGIVTLLFTDLLLLLLLVIYFGIWLLLNITKRYISDEIQVCLKKDTEK